MMKTKASILFQQMIILFMIIYAGNTLGQTTNCLFSTHFDNKSPRIILGGWHNYVTEVKDSKLSLTLDDKTGNQWYNWTLEYIDQAGALSPIDFSIIGNNPVVRLRAKASDTVRLSVLLVDKNNKVLGNSEANVFASVDLTTSYQDFTMDFSGLFYDWDNNLVDSTAIKGIMFTANSGYSSFPFTNSFGQYIDKAFNGTIEFDWVATGDNCQMPDNYLNFSISKNICKDSLVKLTSFSGNFVNASTIEVDPGLGGTIVSSYNDEYILQYSSIGIKTIEMSFTDPTIAPSYIETVKVKDCSPGAYDQKVIGYISSYGINSNIDYSSLSHAMFAFLDINPNGSIGAYALPQQQNFDEFKAEASKAHTKKIISLRGSSAPLIPGWTGIEEVAKSATAIQRFADTLVKFCLYHQLDGVDMDWEGLSTAIERDRYTQLMDTLERHLHVNHLLLTATLPFTSVWGQWFADAALEKADWLQIMIYDATGTWPQSQFGNHSSFQHLLEAETYWTNRGYSREQLVMGVPFYGYKFNSTAGGLASSIAYKDIVALFPMMDNTMNQTPGNDLTVFNGPDLVRQKCRYLKEKDFGGVMIWEMSQDAFGPKSLFKHMICALKDDVGCTDFIPCTTGDISTGLVGQWDFDGDAKDKSGNNNDGSIDYGKLTIDRYGNLNNAVSSSNNDLYVNFGSDVSLSLDSFTVSVWINPALLDPNGSMIILNKRVGCSSSYTLSLKWDQVVAELNSDLNKYTLASRTFLIPGNWYHVVLSHSYSTGTKLYINGLLDQQDNTKFHLVKEVIGHVCGDEYLELGHVGAGQVTYQGKVDDVRLYNKALTQCDIDGLFYPYYSNDKTTDIVNKEEGLNINVYPNPSNGAFTVNLPITFQEEGTLTINNSLGQQVGVYSLSQQNTEIQKDMEDGIYYLTINVNNKRYAKKLIIQNGIK